MTEVTKGQYRVGISFNPSSDPRVDQIKAGAAALIDLIDELPQQDAEQARLKALAQTAIEDGAMWAVKAATKQPMPDSLFAVRPHAVGGHSSTGRVKDPFEEACRDVAVSVLGSIGPWEKEPLGWQVMDMLHLLRAKGFANTQISDVYETLKTLRQREGKA